MYPGVSEMVARVDLASGLLVMVAGTVSEVVVM